MNPMNPMNTPTPTPTPTRTAAEMKEQIAADYPTYFRAWSSMVGNYSKKEITPNWRGVLGLMRFIKDTSTLENNPDTPGLDVTMTFKGLKLKRKLVHFPFSITNVYWYFLPKYKKKYNPTSVHLTTDTLTTDTLATLSKQEQEARIQELIEMQLQGHTFTQQQEAELTVLSALVLDGEVPVIQSTTTYEEI